MAGNELLSKEQLDQILDALEERLNFLQDRSEPLAPSQQVFSESQRPKSNTGRQRSPYTGQLHYKVLEEDQIWFQQTARYTVYSKGSSLVTRANFLRHTVEKSAQYAKCSLEHNSKSFGGRLPKGYPHPKLCPRKTKNEGLVKWRPREDSNPQQPD